MILPVERKKFYLTNFTHPFGVVGVNSKNNGESCKLSLVDIDQVNLVTMLCGSKSYISAKEKLKRCLANDFIPLDACIFFAFWNNKEVIPQLVSKNKIEGDCVIYFDGTVIEDKYDDRYALCLKWSSGELTYGVGNMGDFRTLTDYSAVLKKPALVSQ